MRPLVFLRYALFWAVGLLACEAWCSGEEPDAPLSTSWERLHLRSGDELLGRSLEVTDGHLLWMFKDGETLHIPLDQIDRLDVSPRPEASLIIPPSPELTDPDEVFSSDVENSWASNVPLVNTLQESYSTTRDAAVKWTQQLQLGGQFNSGNTNTSLINFSGVLEQNTKDQMRQIDFGGQWGHSKTTVTANRWWLNSNFDWPVYEKWIMFVTSKNEYNGPANLDYRGTISSGTGYRFLYEDKRRLIVRFGPAYLFEVFKSPSHSEQVPSLFGELEMKLPIKNRATLEQTTRIQPGLIDPSLILIYSNMGLIVDLDDQSRWKLRVGFQYQYNSQPNAGRVPSDYMTTLSLVYHRK